MVESNGDSIGTGVKGDPDGEESTACGERARDALEDALGEGEGAACEGGEALGVGDIGRAGGRDDDEEDAAGDAFVERGFSAFFTR